MTVADMQRAKLDPNVNKGGRPDKVDATFVKRANDYVNGKWKDNGNVIPTAEGLAEYIDISRKTLYEAPELSDTLERLQRIQANMVLNKGLTGEYNANIAKLILSAKHGYIERQQTENVNVNVEVGSAKPELASGFADYLKQQTAQPVKELPQPEMPANTDDTKPLTN